MVPGEKYKATAHNSAQKFPQEADMLPRAPTPYRASNGGVAGQPPEGPRVFHFNSIAKLFRLMKSVYPAPNGTLQRGPPPKPPDEEQGDSVREGSFQSVSGSPSTPTGNVEEQTISYRVAMQNGWQLPPLKEGHSLERSRGTPLANPSPWRRANLTPLMVYPVCRSFNTSACTHVSLAHHVLTLPLIII